MLTVDNPLKEDFKNMPLAKCSNGNAMDTYFTLKCFRELERKMEGFGYDKVLKYIMSPALEVFRDMELKGMHISTEILESLARDLKDKKSDIEDELYKYPQIKNTFDIGKDIIKILYSCYQDEDDTWQISNDYGFGVYPPDRTEKEKDPRTNKDAILTIQMFVIEEINKRKLDEQSI
jgi:hypothetical protein